jgi:hypothetical protein
VQWPFLLTRQWAVLRGVGHPYTAFALRRIQHRPHAGRRRSGHTFVCIPIKKAQIVDSHETNSAAFQSERLSSVMGA